MAQALKQWTPRRGSQSAGRRQQAGSEIEPEYWVVDHEQEAIRSVVSGRADVVAREKLPWHPSGASEPLLVHVPDLFR